ncbi:MAG: hypothetical protein JNM48_13590 [Rhodospirillales bacterium]|nr:hypothetical protein [Rhodospirillales bacterium]
MPALLRTLHDSDDTAGSGRAHRAGVAVALPLRLLPLPVPLAPLPAGGPDFAGTASRALVKHAGLARRTVAATADADEAPYAWLGRLICMITAAGTTFSLLLAML